ncbi:hypothetical protein ElyMa_003896400 [Elysia marginata]|uniref:Uncharacterized protein n=1 Tax=Elysia marginata TaxID=1093978 RepID=A0AAV4FM67_9GAST|nr:hypothetical protein ElyMa_003896400 [Elysia marginata]
MTKIPIRSNTPKRCNQSIGALKTKQTLATHAVDALIETFSTRTVSHYAISDESKIDKVEVVVIVVVMEAVVVVVVEVVVVLVVVVVVVVVVMDLATHGINSKRLSEADGKVV